MSLYSNLEDLCSVPATTRSLCDDDADDDYEIKMS